MSRMVFEKEIKPKRLSLFNPFGIPDVIASVFFELRTMLGRSQVDPGLEAPGRHVRVPLLLRGEQTRSVRERPIWWVSNQCRLLWLWLWLRRLPLLVACCVDGRGE